MNWWELDQDTGPTLQPVQLNQAPSKRACGIDELPHLGDEVPKMYLLTPEHMSVSQTTPRLSSTLECIEMSLVTESYL